MQKIKNLFLNFRSKKNIKSSKTNTGIWNNLLTESQKKWDEYKNLSQTGKPVLMALSVGGFVQGTLVESAVAAALTLRGAKVDILLCDEVLSACQHTKIDLDGVTPEQIVYCEKQPRCKKCYSYGQEIFSQLGLPVHLYSQYMTLQESTEIHDMVAAIPFDEIENFTWQGLAIGEHAKAGALRFYARGDLLDEPYAEPILRRYLESALMTASIITNLLDQFHYDVVCFNHGIYVPQGIIGEVCRNRGIRVVNWNPSYRKSTFIFSHENTYHHTMISEATSTWENLELTPQMEEKLSSYLKSRWYGTNDWIWFHEKPESGIDKIVTEIGMDFSRPVIGMLTSVMWDAQLHYHSNAFNNMLDWVIQTIQYFSNRPDLQLLIRIHPAEIRGMIPSRQPILAEIQKRFPKIPENIYIIAPESAVSTYAAMELCNAVIIYNTKTGIEISSMGIPVIVAGEAWIRNKGFSLDATSPEEYFQILDRLPFMEKMDETTINRARKYAYHFFFRRMIELPFFPSQKEISLQNITDLLPDQYKGLDIICDGIINGVPFIYPDEDEKG